MFLGIDKKAGLQIAVKDNEGNALSYKELVDEVQNIAILIEQRSIVFCLCKNTVGALAGYLGFIEGKSVPIMLSCKIEMGLLESLIREYTPAYLWVPREQKNNFPYVIVFEKYDYCLLKTDYLSYPIHQDLQLLMTTSGSTGSPKLVRYKKGNLEANAKNVAKAFGWTLW